MKENLDLNSNLNRPRGWVLNYRDKVRRPAARYFALTRSERRTRNHTEVPVLIRGPDREVQCLCSVLLSLGLLQELG